MEGEDQQVIVEMQSQEISGGNDKQLPDSASGGPISQKPLILRLKLLMHSLLWLRRSRCVNNLLPQAPQPRVALLKLLLEMPLGALKAQSNIEDQFQKLRSDLSSEVQMGLVELEMRIIKLQLD